MGTPNFPFGQQQNPQPQPQQSAPPQFNNPYAQPVVQTPDQNFVTQEQLRAAVEQVNGLSNQISQLTGAVNGLGQNQEALHQWLVSQAQNISSLMSSIANSIKAEGAMGFLRSVLGGAPNVPLAPPAQPTQPQYPQQGFPPSPQG